MLIRRVTDIEIGRARAQHIPSPTPGSAESAPNRYHQPAARKMRDQIFSFDKSKHLVATLKCFR